MSIIGKFIITTSEEKVKVLDKVIVDSYTRYLCEGFKDRVVLLSPRDIKLIVGD